MKIAPAIAVAVVIGISAAAYAQSGHQGHGGHQTATASESAATAAYRAANGRMHKDMDITYSGDADVDFVRGMIPHHQGAIDMAKVILAHGKDPKLRKLAADIIAAQEREIAEMREWLRQKGK